MNDDSNIITFPYDQERHVVQQAGEDDSLPLIIHGVFLEVRGLGVLLTGDSGVGKSELALELITRGHRLIADDAPEFSRDGLDKVHGTCPDALCDFLEVRDLGIMNIRAMFGDNAIQAGQDLHLIIHLKNIMYEKLRPANRLKGNSEPKNILSIDIPVVTLPAGSGRNLAVLVEAAARHHILLRKGYNASDAFIVRQQQILHQQNKRQQNPETE